MLEIVGYTTGAVLRSDADVLLLSARREQDGRAVLLKLPAERRPATTVTAKLEHEYSLQRLLHPTASLRCLGRLRAENRTVLVFEDNGGRPLDRILTEGALPARRFLPIAIGAADALRAVHKVNLLHKDVRPGNLMVGGPSEAHVLLTDFGIAAPILDDREAAVVGGRRRLRHHRLHLARADRADQPRCRYPKRPLQPRRHLFRDVDRSAPLPV